VAQTVVDLGDKGTSDGMESDAEGNIDFGDVETNSIRRRLPDGNYELLAHDPRILWPDTFSLATNGYLYITANQLHRQPGFHYGVDQRQKPYVLFRLKLSGTPISSRPIDGSSVTPFPLESPIARTETVTGRPTRAVVFFLCRLASIHLIKALGGGWNP
jgi:hypothetical protein